MRFDSGSAGQAVESAGMRRSKWQVGYPNSADFNFDYHVSFSDEQMASGTLDYNYQTIDSSHGLNELPGFSVFIKNEAGEVFHTYSSYARGNEEVIGAFIYLDTTPKGRNESQIMDWVKRNDEYDAQPGKAGSCCA